MKSKSMAGFDAPYVPGWDCHGLPIEFKVDSELGKRKATMTVAEIHPVVNAAPTPPGGWTFIAVSSSVWASSAVGKILI